MSNKGTSSTIHEAMTEPMEFLTTEAAKSICFVSFNALRSKSGTIGTIREGDETTPYPVFANAVNITSIYSLPNWTNGILKSSHHVRVEMSNGTIHMVEPDVAAQLIRDIRAAQKR